MALISYQWSPGTFVNYTDAVLEERIAPLLELHLCKL